MSQALPTSVPTKPVPVQPVDTPTSLGVDRHCPAPDPHLTKATLVDRVYKPKIPFPRKPQRSKQELADAKCKAMMEKLIVEMPLIDAGRTSPVVR